jgi:hypothetical protein
MADQAEGERTPQEQVSPHQLRRGDEILHHGGRRYAPYESGVPVRGDRTLPSWTSQAEEGWGETEESEKTGEEAEEAAWKEGAQREIAQGPQSSEDQAEVQEELSGEGCE